jgi:hypothetical protein
MNSKTLLLALVAFGVATYLVYQLEKKRMVENYYWNGSDGDLNSSGSDPSQNDPDQPSYPSGGSDQGGQDQFGLSNFNQEILCQLAPSLCTQWSIPMPITQPNSFGDSVSHTPPHVYRLQQNSEEYI